MTCGGEWGVFCSWSNGSWLICTAIWPFFFEVKLLGRQFGIYLWEDCAGLRLYCSQVKGNFFLFLQGKKVEQTENSDPAIAVGKSFFNIFFFLSPKNWKNCRQYRFTYLCFLTYFNTGPVRFSGVDFSGTVQVQTSHDDDFIGLVFSYQSNRKFYLVSWKQQNQVYWEMNPFRAKAVRGIQIKVMLFGWDRIFGFNLLIYLFYVLFFLSQLVNSDTGPGPALRNALWNSGNAQGQVSSTWRE